MENWKENEKQRKKELKKKEEEYRKGQWKIFMDIEKSKNNPTNVTMNEPKNKIEANSLPLKPILVELIQKNSDMLAIDLKKHLEGSNKISNFEVDEIYPLLYNSLIKELLEHFQSFNKDDIYTREIESGKYSEFEKRAYYDSLLLDTASKLMTFKKS